MGRLGVKKLSDNRPAWVVNATAPPSHTQITVMDDTHLYRGGLPSDYQVNLKSMAMELIMNYCLPEYVVDNAVLRVSACVSAHLLI